MIDRWPERKAAELVRSALGSEEFPLSALEAKIVEALREAIARGKSGRTAG